MRLAVIPARGGSKRIPRKNIKPFFGKPMIVWSISAAQASGCFDRIVVSTDDEEIAELARQYGAEVPFLRPKELSDDFTGTLPVIRHAVLWFEEHEAPVDYACCIYATAPFLRAEDIQQGWETVRSAQCSYAVSATSYAFPIQRAFRLNDDGRLSMFNPEQFQTRSQDLEEAYHDAGQFYWGVKQAWLELLPFFGEDTIPVILPRHRVQDIDTQEDWQRAEIIFRLAQEEEQGE